jgi:hypothetical protein
MMPESKTPPKGKKDWENVKKRWEAWWNFDVYDRVPVVVARHDGTPSAVPPAASPEDYWLNRERRIAAHLEELEHTEFLGESVPFFGHGWSIGTAMPFGSIPDGFTSATVWCEPFPAEEDVYPDFAYDPDGKWAQWFEEYTRMAARQNGGRFYMQAMWGNHAGDVLALLRGSETLMFDIIENPEWVEKTVKYISDSLMDLNERMFTILEDGSPEGYSNSTGTWAPKRMLGYDCDISCMVSADVFKKIFLPPLVETMETVDYRIYHLDGASAIHHLDALLDLPQLQAIQWVQGDGGGRSSDWMDLIKKVQSKKKSIILYCETDEIIPILKEAGPKGIAIYVVDRPSEQKLEAVFRELKNII